MEQKANEYNKNRAGFRDIPRATMPHVLEEKCLKTKENFNTIKSNATVFAPAVSHLLPSLGDFPDPRNNPSHLEIYSFGLSFTYDCWSIARTGAMWGLKTTYCGLNSLTNEIANQAKKQFLRSRA